MIPALAGADREALLAGVLEPLLAVLPEPGHVVLPGVLPPELVTALRDELRERDAEGCFHAAGIGRGSELQIERRIRGDRIAWLEESWPAAACYLTLMDDLRQALNRACYLGLAEYEAHYACYGAGSFYRRHVDRHAGTPDGGRGQRVISTVCYLNEPGWPADAGGELLLYPEAGGPLRVPPEGGTLVLFRSETIPHEVLAAQRERLSIAGWMRTRD